MHYSAVIVDDEHLIRSSLTNKLKECRNIIAAGSAANGVKCLEWLSGHYADICITDVRMPHMDGLEMIHAINEKYPHMTCIVVSSHDDFVYVRKSLQLNAVDYVMKPIEQSVLNEVLELAVKRIRQTRKERAVSLLMRKMPNHAALLERWVSMLQAAQMEKTELLVVDTLEMMESWVGEDYHLLHELTATWLELVSEQVKLEPAESAGLPGEELELEPQVIARERMRFYFRLVCVGMLENGARRMLRLLSGAKNNGMLRTMEQVKHYLQEHYAEKINLQDVADEVSMSRTYLASLFKQETGSTIWGYLLSVRMRNARDLLLTSSLKSYEIALKVGYEDSIHFSKMFKEYYGLTPMEYKKRMQELIAAARAAVDGRPTSRAAFPLHAGTHAV